MTADIYQFPHPEEHIDINACIRRDEEAVQAGMIMYAQMLHGYVAKFPNGFFHPVVQDGVHVAWCTHQEPESGFGCRRSSLIEAIEHALEAHPDGGNCGA